MEQLHKRHVAYTGMLDRETLERLEKEVHERIEEIEDKAIMCIHGNSIMHIRIDPEHRVEDIIADDLSAYHGSIIVVESRRGCFVKKKGMKAVHVRSRAEEVIRRLEDELDCDGGYCDLLDFNEMMIADIFA